MSDLTELERDLLSKDRRRRRRERARKRPRVRARQEGRRLREAEVAGRYDAGRAQGDGAPLINGLRDAITGPHRGAPRHDSRGSPGAPHHACTTESRHVTLPVRESPEARGRIHPLSQVFDELVAIFADMGFSIADGPDVETDYYNFTALNFPVGHPAREMHDTFFLREDEAGERKVLRTHTSPVQIRTDRRREARRIRVNSFPRAVPNRHDSDQTHKRRCSRQGGGRWAPPFFFSRWGPNKGRQRWEPMKWVAWRMFLQTAFSFSPGGFPTAAREDCAFSAVFFPASHPRAPPWRSTSPPVRPPSGRAPRSASDRKAISRTRPRDPRCRHVHPNC